MKNKWQYKKNEGVQPVGDDVLVDVMSSINSYNGVQARNVRWEICGYNDMLEWRLHIPDIDNALINHGDVERYELPKIEDDSDNNGGSTDYYKLDPSWKDGMDIIEARKMNYSQGSIFKAAMIFNVGRHSGTNPERDLNKIIWHAKRELQRIKSER